MRRRVSLAVLCGLWWLGPAVRADDLFQVDTASRLAYPLRAPSDHYAIAVNFDAARYALTAVAMLPTSNGPGGAPLVPNDDVAVTLAPEAGAGHAILDLKPRPASFRFPGEYRIALNFIGRTLESGSKPVSSNVTLSITRLAPQFDVDAINGRSVTLYRRFPWSPASGSIQYPLQPPQYSDAADVSVSPLGLEWVASKDLVPDAVVSVSPTALSLRPGRPQNLIVSFSALPYAGDFATTLRSIPIVLRSGTRLGFPCT